MSVIRCVRPRRSAALLAAGLLVAMVAAPAARADEFPPCTDKEVVDFVLDAFDYTQIHEHKSPLRLKQVTGIRELGTAKPASGRWRAIRGCAGTGRLSDGQTIELWYQVVLPRNEKAVNYRVPVCFAKYGSRTQGDCKARLSRPPAS